MFNSFAAASTSDFSIIPSSAVSFCNSISNTTSSLRKCRTLPFSSITLIDVVFPSLSTPTPSYVYFLPSTVTVFSSKLNFTSGALTSATPCSTSVSGCGSVLGSPPLGSPPLGSSIFFNPKSFNLLPEKPPSTSTSFPSGVTTTTPSGLLSTLPLMPP